LQAIAASLWWLVHGDLADGIQNYGMCAGYEESMVTIDNQPGLFTNLY
jgi:hypothetical protein